MADIPFRLIFKGMLLDLRSLSTFKLSWAAILLQFRPMKKKSKTEKEIN